jgi:hypothetical protein
VPFLCDDEERAEVTEVHRHPPSIPQDSARGQPNVAGEPGVRALIGSTLLW